MTLTELAALSIDERVQAIDRLSGDAISATYDTLALESPAVAVAVTCERVAWALAGNVTGELCSSEDARRGARSYLERWPTHRWSDALAELTTARPRRRGVPTSGLWELTRSVACERRGAWQRPGTPRLDPARAEAAFVEIYTRHRTAVVGFVADTFGRKAGEPQDVADEAWSIAFRKFWSEQATSRFLGFASVPTLLMGIARFTALRELSRRKRLSTASGLASVYDELPVAEPMDESPDPSQQLARKGFDAALADCLNGLPPRQRLFADMVLVQGRRAVDAAREHGVTAANVSYHLAQATPRLSVCMRAKGHDQTPGFD